MGKCLIQSLTRVCGYQTKGIDEIRLLDLDDFERISFAGDGPSTEGLITGMKREGKFIDVCASEASQYSSSMQKGVYTHTVETFIPDLTGEMQAALNLAARRRFLTIFRAGNGRNFLFGWEAGATLNYTNQTDGGLGSLVTISAQSIHPLFEIDREALRMWILATGQWDNTGYWYNNSFWKWK